MLFQRNTPATKLDAQREKHRINLQLAGPEKSTEHQRRAVGGEGESRAERQHCDSHVFIESDLGETSSNVIKPPGAS